jgi:hypothetical protein
MFFQFYNALRVRQALGTRQECGNDLRSCE